LEKDNLDSSVLLWGQGRRFVGGQRLKGSAGRTNLGFLFDRQQQ
jgi:hypothetical protein